MMSRARNFGVAFANSMFVGIITATLTIGLALLFVTLTGDQQDRHRVSTRCIAHETILAIEKAHGIDVRNVNIDGLDCGFVFEPLPLDGE